MKQYYIARDKDGRTFLFYREPMWGKRSGIWKIDRGKCNLLDFTFGLKKGECRKVKIVLEPKGGK